MTRYRWLFALCACLALAARPAGASTAPATALSADAPIDWFTCDAGAGASWVDDILLESTMGQPDCGIMHVAASLPCGDWDVRFTGGFWVPFTDANDDDIANWLAVIGPGRSPVTASLAGEDLDEAPIREFSLAPISPNPTRGRVRLDWAVPSESRVNITVLDVQGRQVAMPASGVYTPGRYSAIWNGQGGGASPGLYFVRFEHAGGVLVRRVILVP